MIPLNPIFVRKLSDKQHHPCIVYFSPRIFGPIRDYDTNSTIAPSRPSLLFLMHSHSLYSLLPSLWIICFYSSHQI